MNKLILISLVIFFAICSKSWTDDTLKPATEILQSDPSPTNFTYIMIRCGALNYALEIFLRDKGDPNSEEMLATIETTKKNTIRYSQLAMQSSDHLNLGYTMDDIVTLYDDIGLMYLKRWRKNYAGTGSFWDDLSLGDVSLCTSILKDTAQ